MPDGLGQFTHNARYMFGPRWLKQIYVSLLRVSIPRAYLGLQMTRYAISLHFSEPNGMRNLLFRLFSPRLWPLDQKKSKP